jgi:hypothetical protein
MGAAETVNCAKCGKQIAVGDEVKKGRLRKKSYHRVCAAMMEKEHKAYSAVSAEADREAQKMRRRI